MTQTTVRQYLDRIEAKRDELRVQLHLAGMDLEREWDHVEEELRGIAEVEAMADEARLQLHLAGMDAKEGLDDLQRRLDLVAERVERGDVAKEIKESMKGLARKLKTFADRATV